MISENRNTELDKYRMDYSRYRFSKKEYVKYAGLYFLLDACISYLFFDSWEAFVLLIPGMIFFYQGQKKILQRKRKETLRKQFMDGIVLMEASLLAGYSAENAIREAGRELEKVYGPEAYMIREFRMIEAQIDMSRNLEELLLDLGRRSDVDDIRSFAEVFLTAKRSGGDLPAIIRNTVSCIRQKQETLQEIETCLAGKVMEQNMMSLIPMLILAYVRLTSPEFVEVLYETLAGTAVMILCFLVYVGAYFWGRKIVQIEV